MRQMKRCFGVKLLKNGKLELVGFLSADERDNYCNNKENHTRPITMANWKNIPKEMKK